MRAIIYAADLEPITVVELPPLAVEYLERRGHVALAVQMPAMSVSSHRAVADTMGPLQVRIWAEKLTTPRGEHLMLFTEDDEAALLLKAAFLPGQRSALRDVERKAVAQGFLYALQRLGG